MPARTLVTLGRISYGTGGSGIAGEAVGALIDDVELSAAIVNGNGPYGAITSNGNGVGGFDEEQPVSGYVEDDD
jgi:hypothetical protein